MSSCSTLPEAAASGTVAAAPTGELRLRIAQRDGRSYAARQFHDGALRILKPLYLDRSGQVAYPVINPGGAYFGADRYVLDLEIGEDASLLSTTQSATKVYRTPQGPAVQDMEVRLGPGAVLEHLPDQLIVYREGSYRQRTLVRMHPSASLLMAEIITPGWSPEGEPFRFDELRLRTEIRVEDGPRTRRLAVDQLRMVPGEGSAMSSMGMMEGHSHTGQLLIADRRLDDGLYAELVELVEDAPTHSGITRGGVIDPDGLRCVAVRTLADSTGAVAGLHRGIVDLLRYRWRGQPPLDLRRP